MPQFRQDQGDSNNFFLSSRVSYNITVSEDKGRAWCYGWNHTDDLTLGDISTTECQEDNSILWSLEKFPHDDAGHDDSDTTSEGQYELAGLNLSVSWQPSDEEGLVAGWHWIPSSDLEWVTVGDEQVQDYQGPESFELNTKDISRD